MDKKKTYHILTFGCQMNERDSETLGGILHEMGWVESVVRNDADIIIINTCSVRDNADKRFFGVLGQIKKIKEFRPDVITAICGCMMQQQHLVDEIKNRYPWVDLIFGTHNIHEFPRLLNSFSQENRRLISVWQDSEEIIEGLPALRKNDYKAYINIMYGCDNYCTYCIVPYTRGTERSRRPIDILDEAGVLVKKGVREITLLGQNVNSYRGNGEKNIWDFTDLLYGLNEVDGLERIRFMTSHPKDLSEKLIQAYAKCEKLCDHIHLPVQSGSTKVLKRMNRRYTKEEYLDLINRLRMVSPDIAITTDIIVGFPGETEEDFGHTLELIEEARFDSAFTFLYSVRKGTPAENYEDQVDEAVKHARFNRLVEKVNDLSLQKNKAMVGRVVQVLVEGKSKTDKHMYSGRTGGFKLVNFSGEEGLEGQLIQVEVIGSNTFSLWGRAL
ncbi:MAG: tRNA (N6-isopentenyl adenosine(37)-C2)-methylthiotransferase MiaB [Anaerovoracaceae bacterium]|jgi:tRNA-2-methylthio-N6-dimethylallyladenosine synthase